jgi:Ca-activated chloride channel family protein
MRTTAALALGCLILAAADLSAQGLHHNDGDATAAAPLSANVDSSSTVPSATFKGGVDLVALTVVVTDPQRRLITGLGEQNFQVFEDGVQQELSFFAASQVPLDLALLLDTSASMSDKMQTMQEAAIGFARTLHDGDRISIVDIKDSVKVLHPLDGDLDGATAAIRSTAARGGTALYNGLYMTLREMMNTRKTSGNVRRQAIAVLSDGEDTASLVSFDDVLDVAKQAGISVYTIALRSAIDIREAASKGGRSFSNAEYAMKTLAAETGALSFFPTDIRELAGVYQQIATELASQYAIGYTPKNPKRDGAFRRVVVQVTEHPGAQTRTRSGYQSPRGDRSTLQ